MILKSGEDWFEYQKGFKGLYVFFGFITGTHTNHNNARYGCRGHEYFAGDAGTPVLVDKTTTMKEPDIGAGVLTFYLSDTYKNYLDLMDSNVPYKF